jgi:tetratricopeptide (TPR) repeat protein
MNQTNILELSESVKATEKILRSQNGELKSAAVTVRVEDLVIPTYLPAPPDKNPMFLEKRVYQGSSGKVYPLPFTDRIAEKPVDRKWQAIWIENEFLRALVLPEIGGRIHAIQDKTNGYDLIYRQRVIKPALVGLAGPWISGGIEFNWPQHHRPATFLPVNFEIEAHADGSKTIWCGDHDPMCRMKGMHGVCLHPGKSFLELKVRAYNRTPFVQTFLWWANVATRVHEAYQSFFPPDVYCIADHAKRATSEYPLAQGFYYGVNYGERGRKGIPQNEIPKQFVPPHCRDKSAIGNRQSAIPNYAPNDLSFYANIPVPTSYMCLGSREDFFGGYDYHAQAGIVHIADHHISPGKKQWTWGNHEFGYAWDRNLTDADENGEFAPYIEIMAGVFTDNQPDFSFLQPGETKSWSQFWYPIQKIGPPLHANLDAAISLHWNADLPIGKFPRSGRNEPIRRSAFLKLGVSVTQKFPRAKIELLAHGETIFSTTRNLAPGEPLIEEIQLPKKIRETDLQICVRDKTGGEIIFYRPKPRAKGEVPPPATEPPAPEKISGNDELFITGLHLEQYRHATRSPAIYWREALRRDPLDSRCNNALGLWHLRRGEFAVAEKHFRRAIERLTRRNPNPGDGEAFYNLGLCLRFVSRDDEAYDSFYKATWNQARCAAGFHALAEIDCSRKNWATALEHLNRSLRFDTDNLRARNLKVMVLRQLAAVGQASRLSQIEKQKMETAATVVLRETLALDPLDWWARHLNGGKLCCDLPTQLDLAHDFARAGFFAEAIDLLNGERTRLACAARRPAEQNCEAHQAVGATPTAAAGTAALPDQSLGALPLVHYTLGWLHQKNGDEKSALNYFKQAAALPPDYCFPARLEEIEILKFAARANPNDSRAPYYLGNLFYDRRRHEEAIRLWEKSAKLDGNFSIVWRNLGIGHFNISKNPAKARAAYDRAFRANPSDARLLFERDQLWKRLGETPEKRLRELEKFPRLVSQRDDLTVEFCALLNQVGRPADALTLVAARKFQPWEGGEGGALGQHVRAQLALGRAALTENDFGGAKKCFEFALTSPRNLGEAKHLLANQSDIHFWLGVALDSLGEKKIAREHWLAAANFKGDFQEMSVRAFSEMTFYSARSLEKLGQKAKAKKLLRDLLACARQLHKTPANIDYFATSLPTMLLFDDDLQFRQATTALFLQAQARLGLGQNARAKSLLKNVLRRDPNHALAADLFGELSPAKVRST